MPDGSTQSAGAPDHTAIVAKVVDDGTIHVLEQNPKPCSYGKYNFKYLVSGSAVCYRVIPPTD